MRGLLNHNIAAFEAENEYGFPEIFPITERVRCDHWVDFDTARRTMKPGAKRPQANGTSGIHLTNAVFWFIMVIGRYSSIENVIFLLEIFRMNPPS